MCQARFLVARWTLAVLNITVVNRANPTYIWGQLGDLGIKMNELINLKPAWRHELDQILRQASRRCLSVPRFGQFNLPMLQLVKKSPVWDGVFIVGQKPPVRVRLGHQDRNGGMSWMNVNPGFFSWWGSPAVIIWYLNGTLMRQPWKLGQTCRGKNTQGPWWMIAYLYIHITRMASTMTTRTRHDKNSRYSDNSSILRYYRV